MKNIIKIFLLLIINLLLINLTFFTTNASMIEKSSKTRLNKVIKKVSIKDDDKRKSFLILLVNLKSKYKDSSDIEGMINYLENNVCAKSTYTQTKINTAINDIITKFKNEGYEKIKTEIIAGIKLLEANPYNAIGVRCQVALYDNINGNKIFGEYERGYLVEADIDNYITNNYSEDVDNTDNITDNDNTVTTNTNNGINYVVSKDDKKCKSANTVKQNEYNSIFDNKEATSDWGQGYANKRSSFKKDIIPNKITFGNEGKGYAIFGGYNGYTAPITRDRVERDYNREIKTFKFKVFLAPGVESVNLVSYFSFPNYMCRMGTIKYWVGPEESFEKLESGKNIWKDGVYQEMALSYESQAYNIYGPNSDYNGSRWVYVKVEFPLYFGNHECNGNYTNGGPAIMTNPIINYSIAFKESEFDKYKSWYNSQTKWETNGDPVYDCGDNGIVNNNVTNNTTNGNNDTINTNNINNSTNITNKCSDPNRVDQNKYFSVYDNQAVSGGQYSGRDGIYTDVRFYFKKEMNPHGDYFKYIYEQDSLSIRFSKFGIPFSGQKTVEAEGVSVPMRTMYFKQFIPPGVYRTDLIYYFGNAESYSKCNTDLMKMKYWVGPVQPKEEIVARKEGTTEKLNRFWKGDMTFVEMSNSWAVGTIGLYPLKPEWSGWVYFSVEFPDMACCSGGYTYVPMTPVFHFKSVENFEKYYVPWYDSIDKANKWEDSDPPSDCTDGNIFGTWDK